MSGGKKGSEKDQRSKINVRVKGGGKSEAVVIIVAFVIQVILEVRM